MEVGKKIVTKALKGMMGLYKLGIMVDYHVVDGRSCSVKPQTHELLASRGHSHTYAS
jgi:hypothetical protein